MSAIERMTITIPSEMAATVRQAVARGEYASTNEVIRDALLAWTHINDEERRELASLRDAIRAGLDGNPPVAAEGVFAQLRARYAAKA